MRRILFLLSLLTVVTPACAALQFSLPRETTADRLYRVIHLGAQFTVYASGEIESGDAARLRSFLQTNSVKDVKIAFDSPGGSLAEGLALGQLIRTLQLDTTIASAAIGQKATCASACAYAFAGGVGRFYDDTAGRLGIHQFYSTGSSGMRQEDVQLVSGVLVSYLTTMGVDANAFSMSTLAKSNNMVWLSAEEADNLGLANNGVQPTTAEIKTINMQPYLRLDQLRSAGHARVIFLCGKAGMVMMAGIVANRDEVAMNSSISQRSYVELDNVEALVAGPGATVVEDDTLWIERGLDTATLNKMLAARELDIWTEGGGAVRFGAMLDLKPVKTKLRTFVADCQSSRRR